MSETLARIDEVERALKRLCRECAHGNQPLVRPRGGMGHKVLRQPRFKAGEQVYWVACGRDDWSGRYLTDRLAELRQEADHAE